MWSGPRNISTAMMRSWGNRTDTVVVDEPFYAFYLKRTGKTHPGADEIIANGESDWHKVVDRLVTWMPREKQIFFQKQMTHHLLPEIDRKWILELTNCFLIRDPREVILSYSRKNPNPALEDLGYVQQLEIYNFVRETTNSSPPVIDARDVLENPERMLRCLCGTINIEFDPAMLSWPKGLRETDGIWAKHWYDAVARSSSFEPYRPRTGEVPSFFQGIYQQCRECYEQLHQHRLK